MLIITFELSVSLIPIPESKMQVLKNESVLKISGGRKKGHLAIDGLIIHYMRDYAFIITLHF
jgi:hypothetical protein